MQPEVRSVSRAFKGSGVEFKVASYFRKNSILDVLLRPELPLVTADQNILQQNKCVGSIQNKFFHFF